MRPTWEHHPGGLEALAACAARGAATPTTASVGGGYGRLPVVTISGDRTRAAVWVVGVDSGPELPPPRPFVEVDGFWANALAAVARSVPVLWRPLDEVRRSLPRPAIGVGVVCFDARAPHTPQHLTGASFGLPFVVAQASRVLELPVPTTWGFTGAVTADGRITPVDGVREKILALAVLCPSIVQVAVPHDDKTAAALSTWADEASRLAGRTIAVRAFVSTAQVLEVVFGDGLATSVLRSASSGDERRQVLFAMRRLVREGRDHLWDFTPVLRAATLALDSWRDLPLDDARELSLIRAICERHVSNGGRIDINRDDDAWLASLPAPVRLARVAHSIQQCADSGSPDVDVAAWLFERHAVRGVDAFDAHLRLLGAWARVCAVRGRIEEALSLQREAAEAFVARHELDDTSYQLAEWYRLAGVLRDDEAFKAADDFCRANGVLSGPSYETNGWIAAPRALALARLGRPKGVVVAAADHARQLAVTSGHHALALRARARALSNDDDAEACAAVEAELHAHATGPDVVGGDDRRAWQIAWRLHGLWRALEGGGETATAVDALRALDAGVVGHIEAAAHASGQPLAVELERLYPY